MRRESLNTSVLSHILQCSSLLSSAQSSHQRICNNAAIFNIPLTVVWFDKGCVSINNLLMQWSQLHAQSIGPCKCMRVVTHQHNVFSTHAVLHALDKGRVFSHRLQGSHSSIPLRLNFILLVQRSLGNWNGTQKKSVVLHLKGSPTMWWWRVRVNLHQQSPVIVFQGNHNKKHRFSVHANKICMSLHQTFNNKAFFCWLQLQLSVITPTHAVFQRMQSSVFNHTMQSCSNTQYRVDLGFFFFFRFLEGWIYRMW